MESVNPAFVAKGLCVLCFLVVTNAAPPVVGLILRSASVSRSFSVADFRKEADQVLLFGHRVRDALCSFFALIRSND
jgi:hypothetical protein